MLDPQAVQAQMAQMEWARQNAARRRTLEQQQQITAGTGEELERAEEDSQQIEALKERGAEAGEGKKKKRKKKGKKKGKKGGEENKAEDIMGDPTPMQNYIFAGLLALIKDLIDIATDLGSGGMVGLLGSAETFMGPFSVLLSWVPFVGTAISATLQLSTVAAFGGSGLSLFFIVWLVKIIIIVMIYMLIGTRAAQFQKGADGKKQFKSGSMGAFVVMNLLDLVPILGSLPLETASVMITYLSRKFQKPLEKITQTEATASKISRTGAALKRGYERYKGKVAAEGNDSVN